MDQTYDETDAGWDEPGAGLLDEPESQEGPSLFEEEPASQAVDAPATAADGSATDNPIATSGDLEPPTRKQRPSRPTGEVAAPLALYRRYRPDNFDDVIGQEHVTEPLKRALSNNRVNHAYLFSGPRGCGKTTSARILARSLNCEQGPTPTPCGQCQSCRDLARGGPGSIDVIEMDAASNGGVDDARDLRERAFFAPVQSRYKIYIVDEAHQVTTAGFNALLKLVEEPPPHVKFIFATTEPEKVIGTIRSRTHHYPFRLVPPKVLVNHLAKLCEAEGVPVEAEVLPLVVRAGAGSVRDSLSVLDQLLGSAAADGVHYESAAALLGYTPDTLLDEIVDAFGARDGRGVFATIDKVIEVGQDPRRFAEDLLRRLRDLVIVAAVPEAVSSGLIDVSGDQAERLSLQVAALGSGELTRAAEVIAEGLTQMRGTTAPRLHLELMCSRVLLPGADVDDRGVHARLERLERRLAEGGVPVVHQENAPAAAPREQWTDTAPPTQDAAVDSSTSSNVIPLRGGPRAESGLSQRAPEVGSAADQRVGDAPPPADPAQARRSGQGRPGDIDATRMRQEWPRVLDEVQNRRRFTWILLSQNAQVVEVADGVLTLGFANPGAKERFHSSGSHDILRDSIIEVLGADLKIVPVEAGGAGPAPSRPDQGRGPLQRPSRLERGRSDQPPADRGAEAPASPPSDHGEEGAPPPEEDPEPDHRHFGDAARAGVRATSGAAAGAPEVVEGGESTDDADLDDCGADAMELIRRELGGEVIHEQDL